MFVTRFDQPTEQVIFEEETTLRLAGNASIDRNIATLRQGIDSYVSRAASNSEMQGDLPGNIEGIIQASKDNSIDYKKFISQKIFNPPKQNNLI